jgi:hypothetical protein
MAFGFWCFLLNVQLVVYFAHGFQVGHRWLLAFGASSFRCTCCLSLAGHVIVWLESRFMQLLSVVGYEISTQ